MKKLIIILVIVGFACFSCEEFCEESNRVAIVVKLYSSTTKKLSEATVSIKGIRFDKDSIDIIDSILYSRKRISQILLPVNPSADTMMFSFENDGLPVDTVKIYYTRRTGFISAKCGCVTYAEIDSVKRTENTITKDSVTNKIAGTVIYRPGVVNGENIRIYY